MASTIMILHAIVHCSAVECFAVVNAVVGNWKASVPFDGPFYDDPAYPAMIPGGSIACFTPTDAHAVRN
jgi:hypothetical protein